MVRSKPRNFAGRLSQEVKLSQEGNEKDVPPSAEVMDKVLPNAPSFRAGAAGGCASGSPGCGLLRAADVFAAAGGA